jgi:hypothetical protein
MTTLFESQIIVKILPDGMHLFYYSGEEVSSEEGLEKYGGYHAVFVSSIYSRLHLEPILK